MTESDWLKGKDADALLAAVAARLSERKWLLLACAVVRRIWDLLPNGPLREAIIWLEDNAGQELDAKEVKKWLRKIDAAVPLATELAATAERAAVSSADPDADGSQYQETEARRTNTAVPLFRAASRAANNAIESAQQAVRQAADAVRALFEGHGMSRLNEVRMFTVQALVDHGRSGIETTLALELKSLGDEMADRKQAKNVRVRQSEAIETVNRMTESATNRSGELEEAKRRGDEKAIVRFLHEQLGNPFRAYRFESHWRTDPVVGIARAIDEDRATDRYFILADALLDADCDEEAILRHCRGTEKHAPEPAPHFRGCWVIDLILQHDAAVFAHPVLTEKRAPAAEERLGLAAPGLFDSGILEALQSLGGLESLDDLDDLGEDEFPGETETA